MRVRAFYTIGILFPLVALAAVASLGGGENELAAGLLPGMTAKWLYPRSAVRELVVYAGVAGWLLRELRRRPPAEFTRLLWRAPVVIAVANFLLPAPFILVNGVVREMFAEEGGRMALRTVVRLLMGFGYVALVTFVREQLRQGGVLRDADVLTPR